MRLTLIFVFFAGCIYGGEDLSPPRSTAARVAAILAAPAWNYERFEAGDDRVLLGVLFELGTMATRDVREVVVGLMGIPDGDPRFRDSRFKAYLINRLIFDIPSETSWRDVPRVLGGIGFPHDVNSAIWPLLIGKDDGTVRIASRSAGYAGPPYHGIEEFDAFSRVFPRRDLSKLTLGSANAN